MIHWNKFFSVAKIRLFSVALLRDDFDGSVFVRGTVSACISAKMVPSVHMWKYVQLLETACAGTEDISLWQIQHAGTLFPCARLFLMPDLHRVCAMSTLPAQSFCRISFWCPCRGSALLLRDHNTSRDAEWPPPLQTLYFPGLFWSDLEFHGNSGLCRSSLLLILLKLHQHSYSDQVYNRKKCLHTN